MHHNNLIPLRRGFLLDEALYVSYFIFYLLSKITRQKYKSIEERKTHLKKEINKIKRIY